MNKQRKVLITITYNEMGIIIDTKAEEVAQPVAKDINVPINDCISRQAAIRWVKTECNPYGKPTLDFESGKKVIEHLEAMPSAQPERKTGRWRPVLIGRWHGFECTSCKVTTEVPCSNGGIPQWKYCPNCGAKMEENEGSIGKEIKKC